MTGELIALGIGLVGAVLATLMKLGWYFAQAKVAQDRAELARFRARAGAELNLDVQLHARQVSQWGPIREEGNEVEEYWAKIWFTGVRITNRSPDHAVSLSFDLEARVGDRTYSLALYRCSEEETRGLRCFPIPLGLQPEATALGSIAFLAGGPVEAWLGDPASGESIPECWLIINDHVSGESITLGTP